MKRVAQVVCVISWCLTTFAFVCLVYQAINAPHNFDLYGTRIDVRHDYKVVLMHRGTVLGVGVLMIVASYRWATRSATLVILSALVYLLSWFPFRTIYKVGLVMTYNTMVLIGMTPGGRYFFLTYNVVLPIAFVVVISLVALDALYRRRSNRESIA